MTKEIIISLKFFISKHYNKSNAKKKIEILRYLFNEFKNFIMNTEI